MLETIQTYLQYNTKPNVGVILNLPGSKRFVVPLLRADALGIVCEMDGGGFGLWPWTAIARMDVDQDAEKATGN